MPSRKDITGRRFGRLVVIEDSGQRAHGQTLWHCRCDCGNERNIVTSSLIKGLTQSCGCIRVERILSMSDGRERGWEAIRELSIDGTQIPSIGPGRKTNRNSSTGVRGVSARKHGYDAYINFKGKRYRLGHFETVDAAAAARERAEKKIYGPFLEWYESQKDKGPPP